MRDLTFGRAGGIRRLGFLFIIACLLLVRAGAASVDPALKSEVEKRLLQEFPSLSALYKDLHSSPEISFQEKKMTVVSSNKNLLNFNSDGILIVIKWVVGR